jgi:hypothetical protein
MRRCKDRYVIPAFIDADEVGVLDIGGADINGGYRVIFDDPRFRYRTVDVAPGFTDGPSRPEIGVA